MADDHTDDSPTPQPPAAKSGMSRLLIVGVIAAVFAGLVVGKAMTPTPTSNGTTPPAEKSLTSVRNDASADYEAALQSGKPIYVLFHSLT